MSRLLYRCLLLLARPFVHLRLRLRARREPAYGDRIGERFGAVPDSVPRGVLWFHAVSAGETIGAAPLIQALAAAYPQHPLLVTTMTPTGSAQVRARLSSSIAHCYAPYDFADAVERFYERVQPRVLVLMETELWPNLIAAARSRGIPVVLINARLSARSARGYGRFPGLVRPMLDALTLICCQFPAHRARFVALGVPPERIEVTGNLKFDQALPPTQDATVSDWRQRLQLAGRWVWIGASTHEGEDAVLLAAYRQLLSSANDACATTIGATIDATIDATTVTTAARTNERRPLLLLVPRHPVRAEAVRQLAVAEGFTVGLQSALLNDQAAGSTLAADEPALDVIIGDTMGDLLTLYGLAQAAFIGGSLVERGGHNPIEPALCCVPLLMGPSRFNFEEVAAAFAEADALAPVTDAQSLAAALQRLWQAPDLAQAAGRRAQAVVAANGGVQQRQQAALAELFAGLSD